MFIYTEIVEQQCYMQEGIKINDGDIIMDVGANIGQSTLKCILVMWRDIFTMASCGLACMHNHPVMRNAYEGSLGCCPIV